jgi:hypothetical protein
MREPQVEEIMTLRWQVQPGALQADRVEAA